MLVLRVMVTVMKNMPKFNIDEIRSFAGILCTTLMCTKQGRCLSSAVLAVGVQVLTHSLLARAERPGFLSISP